MPKQKKHVINAEYVIKNLIVPKGYPVTWQPIEDTTVQNQDVIK